MNMNWEEFKQKLKNQRILWNLPRRDPLRKRLPSEGRKLVDNQNKGDIIDEIQSHWMVICSDDMLENYNAELIADQVGLAAERETDDFDMIIEKYADGKGDRILMRQYISLMAFSDEDINRPWDMDS
jgi:hypothetical protein